LSATKRLGRLRRPPAVLRIKPCRIRFSAWPMSDSWPGVSKKVINLPLPSQRIWILVVKPPRLRPKASASALLFLLQQHVDGLARSSSQQSGSPNQHCFPAPGSSASRKTSCSTLLTCANAEIGCKWLSTSHTAPAYLSKVLLFVAPIKCRSGFAGDPVMDGRGWACSLGAVPSNAPIAHS